MKTQGIVRRATKLPAMGDLPERIWIGVREDSNPVSVHNLFIPAVDEVFTKDDPIEWDDELVYFKEVQHKLIQKSPGLVPSLVRFTSFRP